MICSSSDRTSASALRSAAFVAATSSAMRPLHPIIAVVDERRFSAQVAPLEWRMGRRSAVETGR